MKLRVCMSCGIVYSEDFVDYDKNNDSICPVCKDIISMGIELEESKDEETEDK